ncbi:hypothetical protein PG993_003823 [Apiospora rasikravindrae]|uniref:Uncharacterized protein n=1 Tax=Apiospora rasikravindrae TaxID=990691 RepID=A0ABR1U0L6_9PEZI
MPPPETSSNQSGTRTSRTRYQSIFPVAWLFKSTGPDSPWISPPFTFIKREGLTYKKRDVTAAKSKAEKKDDVKAKKEENAETAPAAKHDERP